MMDLTTTPQPSMAEVKAAVEAFGAEIGPRADVTLLFSRRGNVSLLARPKGSQDREMIHAHGSDWLSAIEAGREEWAKRAEAHAANTIRDLALAVIRITDETGACTDAQLRGSDFDQADIDRFGGVAVERANDMAASGPFAILVAAGANAEAA